jgi:lipoprotein-anchoring transpeptidase ErfK/SrfK
MKQKIFLTLMPILLAAAPATAIVAASPVSAQSWRWGETGPRGGYYRERSYYYPAPSWDYRAPPSRYYDPYERRRYYDGDDDDQPRRRSSRDRTESGQMPKLMSGGARPEVDPIAPERISFRSEHAAGTIIIDTAGRQLLLVQAGGTALRYPISVGREGFSWTGSEKISRIAEWPDWHPPAEMRERDPKLPEKMTGGIRNPLGAKALYLGNTLYRIHGTNDAKSIGRASSSGCFRMLNGHVIDLSERVGIGTKVVVVSSLRVASGER